MLCLYQDVYSLTEEQQLALAVQMSKADQQTSEEVKMETGEKEGPSEQAQSSTEVTEVPAGGDASKVKIIKNRWGFPPH